jgi:hypothetical protein
LKFEDGWYLGVVTGVDEVAGGTFSLVLFWVRPKHGDKCAIPSPRVLSIVGRRQEEKAGRACQPQTCSDPLHLQGKSNHGTRTAILYLSPATIKHLY